MEKLQQRIREKKSELMTLKKNSKNTSSATVATTEENDEDTPMTSQTATNTYQRLDYSTSMVLKQIEQFQLEKRKKSKAFKEEVRDNYKK